jgi:tetratricopeptide (TPR) repeat protein
MSAFRSLVRELHRRSVWQVLGVYVVGSWVAYQVVLSLVEGLGLPDWVAPTAVVLFVIGLPIVLATAVVQEGLPGAVGDGQRATAAAGGDAAHPAARGDAATPGDGAIPADGADPSPAAPVRTAPAHARRLFTWKGAITGGVLAFAALGIGVVGFMGMRSFGIGPMGSLVGQGELAESDHVIVAEFNPLTGDSAIAAVVAEAVRVDLTQSSLLNVVDRSRIRNALERMGRTEDVTLSPDVAREVAYRLGAKAVIEGEVGDAAGSYMISARLVTPDSGRVLAGFRETAADSTDLLPAVDRLARRLREKAGESLRTIRANPPLTQVTTASLPALRKYVRAREILDAGSGEDVRPLLEEAVALDPEFATAHRMLGISMWNRGDRGDSMFHHLQEALRLEDRLTEYERHRVRGFMAIATHDLRQAQRSYEAVLALDSTDHGALTNLAVVEGLLGRRERALELTQRVYDLGFRGRVVYWNLVQNYLDLGRYEDAEAVIALEADEGGRPERAAYMQWMVEMARGDFEAAAGVIRRTREEVGRPEWGRGLESETNLLRGDLEDLRRFEGQLALRESAVARLYGAIFLGYVDLFVRHDPEGAGDRVARAVADSGLAVASTADLPLPAAALVLALAERPGAARDVVTRFRSGVRPELVRQHEPMLQFADGFADLAEGRVEAGLMTARRARGGVPCQACADALLAHAYETAGRVDSAIAAYELYLTTPWADRHNFDESRPPNDMFVRAHILERLAGLYLDRGQEEEAARHLGAFVGLWKDADPELQPRVQEARRRLAQLTGEG